MSEQSEQGQCETTTTATPELSETDARQIASEWHSGQGSALYSLASTGHIDHGAEREIERAMADARSVASSLEQGETDDTRALSALLAYVQAHDPCRIAETWGHADAASVIADALALLAQGTPAVGERTCMVDGSALSPSWRALPHGPAVWDTDNADVAEWFAESLDEKLDTWSGPRGEYLLWEEGCLFLCAFDDPTDEERAGWTQSGPVQVPPTDGPPSVQVPSSGPSSPPSAQGDAYAEHRGNHWARWASDPRAAEQGTPADVWGWAVDPHASTPLTAQTRRLLARHAKSRAQGEGMADTRIAGVGAHVLRRVIGGPVGVFDCAHCGYSRHVLGREFGACTPGYGETRFCADCGHVDAQTLPVLYGPWATPYAAKHEGLRRADGRNLLGEDLYAVDRVQLAALLSGAGNWFGNGPNPQPRTRAGVLRRAWGGTLREPRQLAQSRRVVIGYPPRTPGEDPFWEAVALRARLGTASRTLGHDDRVKASGGDTRSAFYLGPYDRAVWIARYYAAFADASTL